MNKTNSNILSNYCSNFKDIENLASLDKSARILLVKSAAECLRSNKNCNKEVSRQILKFFGKNEHGFTPSHSNHKPEIEKKINNFSIAVTGARKGDVLVGCSKGSEGASIKIHNSNVPPNKSKLDHIRSDIKLWEIFIEKLQTLPFFNNMTRTDIEYWLEMNEREYEFIGNEGELLEVIQPGQSTLSERIDSDDLERIMSPNPDRKDGYWEPEQIEALVTGKTPGTSAKKDTLIFIKPFWRINVQYFITNDFKGEIIDIRSGNTLSDIKDAKKLGMEVFLIKGFESQTKIPRDIGILSFIEKIQKDAIPSIIKNHYGVDISKQQIFFKNFTGSSYKSLLQKIIRFAPKNVQMKKDIIFPAKDVLLGCLGTLAMHSGEFVPNIQKYVTGMEAFSKRSAVTIIEDSYVDNDDQYVLTSMFTGSILSRLFRKWTPSKNIIILWLDLCLKALESKKAFILAYKEEITRPRFFIQKGNTPQKNSSAILDNLGAFPTDLGLARGLARDFPNVKTTKEYTSRPNTMHICHCVDHHWAPQVAHFFDYDFVKRVSKGSPSSLPFQKLFWVLWEDCSSINPRKDKIDFKNFENQKNIVEIRKAQKLFLLCKQTRQYKREEVGFKSFKYKLDDSWLAGMLGTIEVKVDRVSMLVTMSTNDILKLVVMKKPTRSMKPDPLSAKQEELAIQMAKEKLRKGISLCSASPPVDKFKSSKVFLIEYNDETYYVIETKDKNRAKWDDIKNLEINIPLHDKSEDRSMKYSIVNIGTGSELDSKESFNKLISETDIGVTRRSLQYLSTFSKSIEINRISREGGSTKQSVILEDVGSYQFILSLSLIYPAALRPSGPGKFDVIISPLLWYVKSKIQKFILEQEKVGSKNGWKKGKDTQGIYTFKDTTRTLKSYQSDIVREMIQNKNKGNFLWATVGLGKTMAVLTYLRHLKIHNKLPKYVLYTLPSSAVKSIIQEIEFFNIPINLIIPLQNITKKKQEIGNSKNLTITQNGRMVPYKINLVMHDHLRKCSDELIELASETFLIVDEVHKTLNDTKRTSVALQLSHLCLDFIVLTGTPVIDSNTYKLINWLEQVVLFEVNAKNFWVAANTMVAKKINTGIDVKRDSIISTMTQKENKMYRDLVPQDLGGVNNNPSVKSWIEATNICYEAANRDIVSKTINLVKNEKKGVMVVAKDKKHSELLYDLISRSGVNSKDIFLMDSNSSIYFTDDAVKNGQVHDYKVVIVPVRKAEGYTLTRLNVMISSVYPSNNATREQIEGRINRVSQNNPSVTYITVHTGILSLILKHHNTAKNLTMALEGLADMINKDKL